MSQRRQRNVYRENEAKGLSPARVVTGTGLALGATFAVAAPAQAADFTVTNLQPDGPGSIRVAINDANAAPGADTVLFQAGLTGTISLNDDPTYGNTGQLEITDSLQINGPGAGQLAISARAESRIFYIDSEQEGAIDVGITGLQLRQGNAKYGEDGPPIGGNILNFGENVTISSSVVRTGVAIEGGGILSNGNLTITNSTISGNQASLMGGGIAAGAYEEGDAVTITGSTINNNGAANTFPFFFFPSSRESADQKYGGGGAALDGDVTISNSTIANNNTAGNGGGVLFGGEGGSGGGLNISSATISGNGAGAGGGVYAYEPEAEEEEPPPDARRAVGDPTIENSIVAGNNADGPPADDTEDQPFGHDLGGFRFNVGYSLIGNPAGAQIDPTTADSNILGENPDLGALSDNGGPTHTMRLVPGSPALDAGRTPTGESTDQRGEDRPSDLPDIANAAGGDGADMGAYESQATPIVPPPPPPEPTGSCKDVDATLSGTNGRDFLRGTPQRDVIRAGGGNDIIRGLGGNDLICAGAGIDVATGGTGNDRIFGQGGNDRIFGQTGRDYGEGGGGSDILAGGDQADELHGNKAKDRVLGADGNDRLFGEGSDDVILGARGNDFIRGGPGSDRLSGGVGINYVQQ